MRTALIVMIPILALLTACDGIVSVTVENVSGSEVVVSVDGEHSARVPPGVTANIVLPVNHRPEHIEVRRGDVVVFSITFETPTLAFGNIHLVIDDEGVSIADPDEVLEEE